MLLNLNTLRLYTFRDMVTIYVYVNMYMYVYMWTNAGQEATRPFPYNLEGR